MANFRVHWKTRRSVVRASGEQLTHTIGNNGGDPGVAYEYNFAYDAAGNRTQWQVVGGTTTYYHCDSANKLLDFGPSDTYPYTGNAVLTYDDKGNTLTETNGSVTTTYTWDYLNRLTRWVKGQIDESYVYNADGMRVEQTPQGGTTTRFLLDGDEIAEEISGSSTTSFVGGTTCLISQISGPDRQIIHADGLGSSRAMTGADEAVDGSSIYDAFGSQVFAVQGNSQFGYAGQYRYYTDPSGMMYLKARYYNPNTGRFVSRDSFGFIDGPNLYNYAHGNPVCRVDPDGHFAWVPIIGIIVIGIGIEQGIEWGVDMYMCNQALDELMDWARYYRVLFPDDPAKRFEYIRQTAAWENMLEYCSSCAMTSYSDPVYPVRAW